MAVVIWTIVSLSTMLASNYFIQWQHYLAIFFLIINGLIFYRCHQPAVIFLALTLIHGVFGILSFDVGLITYDVYWSPFNAKIPLFFGNVKVFGLLILHFIISRRYYVGILTVKYWETLMSIRGGRE